MPHRFLPMAAVAVLFLAGCSRDVEYYQEHTDEAQAKLGECLKMDNSKEDKECNAAAAALKKNFGNTVNNLMNMGQWALAADGLEGTCGPFALEEPASILRHYVRNPASKALPQTDKA